LKKVRLVLIYQIVKNTAIVEWVKDAIKEVWDTGTIDAQ